MYCDPPTLSVSNTTTSTKFDKTLIRVLTQALHTFNVKFNDLTDNFLQHLKCNGDTTQFNYDS